MSSSDASTATSSRRSSHVSDDGPEPAAPSSASQSAVEAPPPPPVAPAVVAKPVSPPPAAAAPPVSGYASQIATGTATEVEAALSGIQSQRGVRGVVVLRSVDGTPVCDTFDVEDREMATKAVSLTLPLINSSREVMQLYGEGNDVESIRVRSDTFEVVVMPKGKFILVIMQRQDVL